MRFTRFLDETYEKNQNLVCRCWFYPRKNRKYEHKQNAFNKVLIIDNYLGAESLGYPGITNGLFKNGAPDLISHFHVHCNKKLKDWMIKITSEPDK